MNRRTLGSSTLVAAFLSSAACKPPQAPGPAVVSTPTLDARDQAALEVERLWQDTYSACEQLDAANCTALYAPGKDTFIIGTEPQETISGHDPIVSLWTKEVQLPKGTTLTIHTKLLTATPSKDNESAWTDDVVTWDQKTPDGAEERDVVRQTSYLEKLNGKWQVVMVHDSVGVPDDRGLALAKDGKLQAPKPIVDDVPPAAKDAVKVVKDALADPLAFEGAIDQGDDVYAIGTSPDDALRGGSTIRTKVANERVQYQFSYKQKGGFRAYASQTGTTAWVATNCDFMGTDQGEPFDLPTRMTFVLEKRDGAWKIVQTHFSIALTPEQLQAFQVGT
jgi:ketosteroid isomerase-like protein